MNGKQVIAKLKAAGWREDRINGSHHVMVKGDMAVPVPVHGTRASALDCFPPLRDKLASNSSEVQHGNSLSGKN
jgi:predicted RNA binding protein YcfA (HicA-like mRNA interferase family)